MPIVISTLVVNVGEDICLFPVDCCVDTPAMRCVTYPSKQFSMIHPR